MVVVDAYVKTCLYVNAKDDEDLLNQHLLAALGALTMSSKNGSVSEILTFNFDDILERYLRLHGFKSQVIPVLPTLREDVDVTVYHPHGFLPRDTVLFQSSDDIVFSKYSFDKRLGAQLNPWQQLLRDLLLRRVGLFIGLSTGSDTLMTVVTDLEESLKGHRIATGFWILGPNDSSDTDDVLLRRNIVPIRFSDYGHIVPFLLAICQSAANLK
jgi:hypothetical protein